MGLKDTSDMARMISPMTSAASASARIEGCRNPVQFITLQRDHIETARGQGCTDCK